MATDSSIGNLLVIGTGLIGGSLALALKRAGAVDRVTGFGRRPEHLAEAVTLGVIDDYTDDPTAAAARADVVFLGVPVGAMGGVLSAVAPAVRPEAVVTDGGSTKVGPIESAREALGMRFSRFVPGHPIAGSERSGVAAARADLFDDHRVLLTPCKGTDRDAVERVTRMWRHCGAVVEQMDATDHDRILGMTSHLPHVLAFALVDHIARGADADRCFELAAGGFLDFTRIAGSDPVMWRDIAVDNSAALGSALGDYIGVLQAVKDLVERGQGYELERLFANARRARELLIDRRRTSTT